VTKPLHFGILAHSAEGAALCLRTFCMEAAEQLGGHMHPDVTLDCIAMGHCMEAWEAGDHQAIRAVHARSIENLARAGAHFFACPDNTSHIALETPGPDLALPGLNIGEVVGDEAAQRGMRRVGVLGTKFTMEGPVYRRALPARGIAVEIPDAEERADVNRIIFDELVLGRFTEASRSRYVEIIRRLKAGGCDGVALVCTEIPLLVTPEVSPLPTLDSTRLLARAALETALGDRPAPVWRGGPVPAQASLKRAG
jgi:aspartate racemase